jgi:hypothetical protein
MRKIFTIAILALSINTLAQIPVDHLWGSYPLNGNSLDVSGNNHNLLNINNVAFSTNRFNQSNSCASFTGNNFLTCNGLPDYDTLSVSTWININTAQFSLIFASGWLCCNGYSAYIFDGIGGAGYLLSVVTGGISGMVTGSTYQLDINRWYNIVLVKESNKFSLYCNGIFQSSGNSSYSTPADSVIFGEAFNGKIDDIRVYNRALNQAEITALYNENLCYETITVTDTLIINVSLTGFHPVIYANTIKVYPNPTSDKISIDCGTNYSTLNGYTIKITNSLSQTVYTSLVTQQLTTIDLNSWTGTGIYFVHLIDANNNTIDIKKIVLQ